MLPSLRLQVEGAFLCPFWCPRFFIGTKSENLIQQGDGLFDSLVEDVAINRGSGIHIRVTEAL